MSRLTRLKPAPLPFPNGGGIQAMATRKNNVKDLERKALEAKHAVEFAKLDEKHRPKPVKAASRKKSK